MGYFKKIFHSLCLNDPRGDSTRKHNGKQHDEDIRDKQPNQTQPAEEPFHLFGLPFELRQEIYYHALTVDINSNTNEILHPNFDWITSGSPKPVRQVSASQFAALEQAISEFGHWRTRRQVVRPNDRIYIDNSMPWSTAEAIIEKCGHKVASWSMPTLDGPVPIVMSLKNASKSDRQLFEIAFRYQKPGTPLFKLATRRKWNGSGNFWFDQVESVIAWYSKSSVFEKFSKLRASSKKGNSWSQCEIRLLRDSAATVR